MLIQKLCFWGDYSFGGIWDLGAGLKSLRFFKYYALGRIILWKENYSLGVFYKKGSARLLPGLGCAAARFGGFYIPVTPLSGRV